DNNAEQAAARSGGEHGNKGIEAAVVVMKMIALRSNLSGSRTS
ncbi:MAG: 6,7-dimethyl-8-ribityllumazine synthase, partial [Flavobacteriales bacterium]|nr:6,7-dimethyl-8-ribityllumazine synthase [Flavobacteriales bacterium]